MSLQVVPLFFRAIVRNFSNIPVGSAPFVLSVSIHSPLSEFPAIVSLIPQRLEDKGHTQPYKVTDLMLLADKE